MTFKDVLKKAMENLDKINLDVNIDTKEGKTINLQMLKDGKSCTLNVRNRDKEDDS